MAEIKYALNENYKIYISTFKETSLDNHHKDVENEYLCEDESQEVINFDKIIEDKYPDPNTRPKAFDALYVDDNNVYLIEFKNQKKLDNKEVIGKLIEGKKELDDILGAIKVRKKDYRFIYCVVHQNCKPHYNRFKCGVSKDVPRFSLAQYKENGFIDDIYTEDVNFFSKQFKKKTLKELMC
ncbi:MAG TPA: hypothetical protein ENK94_00950 [Campylobacterales bacterium]|nr:hypothetical protein [Campylobacterales bacterium]